MVDTSTPEKLARYKTRVPMGRIGEPEDVAYAALYLASDEASMVTAAILTGGRRHAFDRAVDEVDSYFVGSSRLAFRIRFGKKMRCSTYGR